ncbi:MAG TPA: hypothetical protein VGR08_09485 [Thermomicrobiales bacterium]|nr:hypothetical protein [Thermomicrobiales bacterium]
MHSIPRVWSALLALVLAFTTVATASTQAEGEYEEINQQMEEIRELELLQPINVSTKTRSELQDETRQDLETDYPILDRQNDQRVLEAFGLIDEDQEIGEVYVELLGEQIAGYYDPETDEMVVVSDDAAGSELSASNEVTYAHEVVHALQDQHFDLESYSDQRIEGSDDESLAITSLIEGDATAAQIQYIIANPGLIAELSGDMDAIDAGSEALDTAPQIISATLLFPYRQGQTFVDAILAEEGWDAVNDAYASPPVSTEQILHPEKYLAGELPVAVPMPNIAEGLGTGWTTFDTNTMGEFQISVILSDGEVSARQAEQAAAGWGGDTYTVVGTEDQNVIAWNSVWDTEDDAAEFAAALAARESGRLDASAETDGTVTTIDSGDTVVRIGVDGTSVTYASAPDETVLAQVDELQAAATPVP